MIFIILIFLQFTLNVLCKKNTEYKVQNVSTKFLEMSEKVQVSAISIAHYGIFCLKNYEQTKICTAINYDEETKI